MSTFPHQMPRSAARSLIALLVVSGSLAACAGGNSYTVSATRCSPAQHQALVGRNVGEIFLPPALPRREISPGQRITEDYNPARLNMYVDVKGWVGRVTCG